MTERKIIPVRVIELELPEVETLTRGKRDREDPKRELPLHDSETILQIRYGCYEKHVGDIRKWYMSQHRNYHKVDGTRSKWFMWDEVSTIAKRSVDVIRAYLARIREGRAACIVDLCVTPHDCLSQLGEFGQYCPVSLNQRGELFDCSVHNTLDYTAEYCGYYYRMSSAEDLHTFLEMPNKFCGSDAQRQLPPKEMLPRRRTAAHVKAMFPKQVELKGFCPVTYQDGELRYEYLIPGDKELVVEYRDKLYNFANEDQLQKFLRLPERYWNLKLPKKLPPVRQPLPVSTLPMLGYMEQSVADAIIKALTAVGCQKPKYPFLSAQKSALLYVAYHLKAFNPRLSEYTRQKYKNKLTKFEEHCQLTTYLGGNMDEQYKLPQDRPIDFDFKMGQFLSLKGQQPQVW
jgi:adenylate/nucleoside-diphosphate kinase